MSTYQTGSYFLSQLVTSSFQAGSTICTSFYAKGGRSGTTQEFKLLGYYSSASTSVPDVTVHGDLDGPIFGGDFFSIPSNGDWKKISFTTPVDENLQAVQIEISGAIALPIAGGTYESSSIQYDNFSLTNENPFVEIAPDGMLIYSTPDSYIKLTNAGVDINTVGGTITAGRIEAGQLEVYGTTTIFGDVTATSISPGSEIESVGTANSAGGLSTFARTDHVHDLEFDTFNEVAGEGFISTISASVISGSNVQFDTGSVLQNFNVGGILAADQINIDYLAVETLTSTGSNKFGDAPDDVHEFTGSFRLIGSASGDAATLTHYFVGDSVDEGDLKFGIGTSDPKVTLEVVGDISASADIAAYSGSFVQLEASDYIGCAGPIFSLQSIGVTGTVTSSGDISSSATIVSLDVETGNITSSGNIIVSGYVTSNDITSSNNISSSGYTIANSITSSNDISASGWLIGENLIVSGGIISSSEIVSFMVHDTTWNTMRILGSGVVDIGQGGANDAANLILWNDSGLTSRSAVISMYNMDGQISHLSVGRDGNLYYGQGIDIPSGSEYQKVVVSGSSPHLHHITASGHISASATSTGSFGFALVDDKIGVGTKNPTKEFEVYGSISSSQAIYVPNIYSTGSANSIDIHDSINITGNVTGSGTIHIYKDSLLATDFQTNVGIGVNSPEGKLVVSQSSTSNAFEVWLETANSYYDSPTRLFVVNDYGNVGIGSGSNPIMGTPDELDTNTRLDVRGGNIHVGSMIGTSSFASGYVGGYGWRIDPSYEAPVGSTGATYGSLLEIDHLTVRGTFSVYELLINRIRATNGSLWVTSVGQVSASEGIGEHQGYENTYIVSFPTASGLQHGFARGDFIRAQAIDWNAFDPEDPDSWENISLYQSDMLVMTASLYGITASLLSGKAPTASMEYVRIGNTGSDWGGYDNRQGAVYLTSDDNYSPYIRVTDGYDTYGEPIGGYSKAQMGNLQGITSEHWGELIGYGFWASGSAYLEGGIYATTGKIANFQISQSVLCTDEDDFRLDTDGGSGKLRLGLDASLIEMDSGGSGILMSGSGDFRFGGATSEYIKFTGDQLEISTTGLIITASDIDMTTDDFHLSSSTIVLDSDDGGKASLGSNADEISMGSGDGIFLSGSGEFRLGGADAEYIKYDGDTLYISSSNVNIQVEDLHVTASQIDMTTDDFHLSSSTIVLDSDDGGKIALGDTADTISLVSGAGIFLSGSGEIMLGDADGEGIKWQNDNLTISSSGFFLGNQDASMSGSNGKIVLTGNVTMSDSVLVEANLQIGSFPQLPSDEYLIGYWTFDERSGANAIDNSSIGNTGTLTNGAGYSFDAQKGTSLYVVSSSNQYVQLNSDVHLPVSHSDGYNSGSSVSWWMKRSSVTSGHTSGEEKNKLRVFGNTMSGYNYVDCYISSSNFAIKIEAEVDTRIVLNGGSSIVADTEWHHNVLSFWDGQVWWYVDGELQKNVNVASGCSGSLIINGICRGQDTLSALGSYFDGYVDEVRMYNTSLSLHEVRALYLNPNGNGNTLISGDQITTGYISSSNYSYTGGHFSNEGTVIDLNLGDIRTAGLWISGSGQAVFSGSISASAGYIAGWTIESDKLVSSNDSIKLEPNGTYLISASDFQVSSIGEMTASAGQIGGWVISDSAISSSDGRMILSSGDKQLRITDSFGNITARFGEGALSETTGSSNLSPNGDFGTGATPDESHWIFETDIYDPINFYAEVTTSVDTITVYPDGVSSGGGHDGVTVGNNCILIFVQSGSSDNGEYEYPNLP